MTGLRIAWDPPKAAHNLRKHGVGFPEAATAFLDDAGTVIRLISARLATPRERRQYLLGLEEMR